MINLIAKHLKIFVLIASLWPVLSFAITETTIGGNVFADITPSNPGPQTDVTIELESFSTDLDISKISWFLNDKLSLERVGAKNFSFKTGDVGKESEIIINITGSNGEFIEKTITINPAEVDIIWEAQTYTPPFYKGKALPIPGSNIKLIALPQLKTAGKLITNDNLSYKWLINFNNQGVSSNKSESQTKAPMLFAKKTASLKVSDSSGQIVAEKEIELKSFSQEIILLEKKPLEKTRFEDSLKEKINLVNQEVIIKAIPLFFDLNNIDNLSYIWRTNGTKIDSQEKRNEMTFRQDGRSIGETNIEIEIINPQNQNTLGSTNFIIEFGKNNLIFR